MGRADRYASGEWNFFCDLCGKKEKSSRGTKTWDGHWVCLSHKEARNPQDFIKGVKDDQSVPWSRVEAPDTFAAAWGTPILDTYGNLLTGSDHSPLLDIGT